MAAAHYSRAAAISTVAAFAVAVVFSLAGAGSAAEAPAPSPASGAGTLSPPLVAIGLLVSSAAFLLGSLRK